MATSNEIAQWMIDRVNAEKWVYQEAIVRDIETTFGPEWVYDNENGNPAISRKVLTVFRKLHGGIEWDKSERRWEPSSCWPCPSGE